MGEPDRKPPSSSATDGPSKKRWGNKKNKRHANKPTTQPAKFRGGKEELDGNCFDCTGYGQSDRFMMKTVQKIADHIGQEYRVGGVTRTEAMTRTAFIIPMPT
jgi:hypothetical protein